jgi:hypothetical protein
LCTDFIGKEGIRIVELGGKGLVAHLLDDDHRRFLVEHLVDGDHGAHLHQGLDDFGRLDGHLVGQVGDGNGFGTCTSRTMASVGACGCLLGVAVAAVTPAALGTAPAGRAGIATGLDGALLGGIFLPGILLGSLGLAVFGLAAGLWMVPETPAAASLAFFASAAASCACCSASRASASARAVPHARLFP